MPFEVLEDKKICKRCGNELPLNAEPVTENIYNQREYFCDYCISDPKYNPNVPKNWNRYY